MDDDQGPIIDEGARSGSGLPLVLVAGGCGCLLFAFVMFFGAGFFPFFLMNRSMQQMQPVQVPPGTGGPQVTIVSPAIQPVPPPASFEQHLMGCYCDWRAEVLAADAAQGARLAPETSLIWVFGFDVTDAQTGTLELRDGVIHHVEDLEVTHGAFTPPASELGRCAQEASEADRTAQADPAVLGDYAWTIQARCTELTGGQ